MPAGKSGRLPEAQRNYLIRQAAELHVAGKTDEEIGQLLDVCRQTVCTWRKRDEFAKCMEDIREVAHIQSARELTNLIPKAWQTVKDAIEQGDAKLAHQLLRDCGALDKAGRINGLDPSKTGGSGGAGGLQIVVNLEQKPNDDGIKTVEVERSD